jgi:hypothetical protein
MQKYFENIYSNKLENIEEMHEFLNAYHQSKLIKDDINQLNRSIRSNGLKQY